MTSEQTDASRHRLHCMRFLLTFVRQVMPGSARTSSRNLSPRTSKLRYWSNEAQAGESSTTGSATSDASASRAAKLDRPIERAGDDVGRVPFELGGEAGRGFADQIGLADAREEARERGDAAGLRFAARDPEYVGEAGQRLRGGVRVGRLRIVDEQRPGPCGRPAPSGARGRETNAGLAGSPRERARARARQPSRRRRSAHCARRAASRCRSIRAMARALPSAACMIVSAST